MTNDEQLECYLDGWVAFVDDVSSPGCTVRDDVTPTDPVQRGYIDSRAAYEAAKRAERERLDNVCPLCGGRGTMGIHPSVVCPPCHGTGRRA